MKTSFVAIATILLLSASFTSAQWGRRRFYGHRPHFHRPMFGGYGGYGGGGFGRGGFGRGGGLLPLLGAGALLRYGNPLGRLVGGLGLVRMIG